MKKKFTVILVLMMIFVLMFAFIGCDNKTDENEGNNDQTVDEGGDVTDNEGGDVTDDEDEEVSTALANSQILGDALSAVLEEGNLNISVKNFEITCADNLIGLGDESIKGDVELSLRKTDTGYDFSFTLNMFSQYEDYYGDQMVYTDISYYSVKMIYVGGYFYIIVYEVTQNVVDGVPYESVYDTEKVQDAQILTYPAPAWDEMDEYLGYTGEGSRVDKSVSVKKINTLQALLSHKVESVPVLEQLGISTVGGVFEMAGRLFDSLSGLVSGETEADADGNRTLSVTIDPARLFDYVVGTLNANMDKTVGEFLDTLLQQDPDYVAGVINKLFPAEGRCLTINQFIAGVEEVLAENGVDITFKAIVDELQEIVGLTTQQIADIVNPLLEDMLDGTISVSINPKEGETLYDTLERTVFDIIGVDTVLGLISPEETDPNTGEVLSSALSSAKINMMVNGTIYGEEGMTVSKLFEQFKMLSVITMLDIETAKVDLDAKFDADNKISSVNAVLDLDINMIVPEGMEEDMSDMSMKIDATAEVTIDYSAKDSAFDVSGFNSVEKQITVNTPFDSNQQINIDEILEKAEIVVEEANNVRPEEIYAVYENGYVDTISYSTDYEGNITFEGETYEDEIIIAEFKIDGTFYFITLVYEAPAVEN